MKISYIKGIILLGLSASMGLSSCQLVNKYQTPEVDSEALFRDKSLTDTTSIANIPWREYFKDPLLQALVDEGIANNHDIQIAIERVKQAEATLGMARAAYFPDVALSGQVQQNRTSVSRATGEKNVLGTHNETYTLGVAVSWEADIWGKLNRQSRAKYAQMLNSHASKNLVQTSLVANIANSYYSLLALDEQLRVTKAMIVLLEESTATMEAIKEAGDQNGASVEQSKALLYGTQVTVPDLEANIRKVENSLSVMLGRQPGPILRSSIKDQTVPQELAYGVPYQMLAKRPDVQQAELGFRSAFEMTNAAQASFYPSITLTSGMIGYGASTLSQFFKPENIIANIVAGLTQPIFARKQLITQYKVAKAEQQASLLTFEKTVLAAGQEVSDIMYTYQSSLSKNSVREQQVKSLETAVYFTQELLKASEANYLEVLNAQQSLLSAQLSQVSDKLEQLQATVNLYRALGGGVE